MKTFLNDMTLAQILSKEIALPEINLAGRSG